MKNLIFASLFICVAGGVNAQTGERTDDQTPTNAQYQSSRNTNTDKTPTTRYENPTYQPATQTQTNSGQTVPGTGQTVTPKPAQNDSQRSSGKASQQ